MDSIHEGNTTGCSVSELRRSNLRPVRRGSRGRGGESTIISHQLWVPSHLFLSSVCFVQLGRPPSRSSSLLHSECLINIYTRNNNDVYGKESLHHLGTGATAKKSMTSSHSTVLYGRLGEEVKNSTCLGIYDEKWL